MQGGDAPPAELLADLERLWAAAALRTPQALASDVGRQRFLRRVLAEPPQLCSAAGAVAVGQAFR
jgi:hypothetical protein